MARLLLLVAGAAAVLLSMIALLVYLFAGRGRGGRSRD
jgi:hypothetical protein